MEHPEMLGGFDGLAVGQDTRPAMRRGAQSNDLRSQLDGPIVQILRDVIESDVDSHYCCPPPS